jgi:hypothetical protein
MINLRNTILVDKTFTEKVFTTLLHEVHHGMGFLSGYLDFFWDRQFSRRRTPIEVYESSTDYQRRMKIAPILNWAKSHFNCPTMSSLPLENIGSAGS